MTPLAARFFARAGVMEPAVLIRRGTVADYARLAALHYRAGAPATVERVLVAEHRGGGVVGVLVVSRPTLNGRWRGAAWPGRYTTRDRRLNAARLNAEVRTISRVIVDPRFRALGIARALVRAYLGAPLTVRTEAVAAMGACCPFFRAAGMRAWRVERSVRDARLARVLRRASVSPLRLLEWRAGGGEIARALRVWADASRGTRALARGPVRAIARVAAGALLAPPVAFTHETRNVARRGRDGARCAGPGFTARMAVPLDEPVKAPLTYPRCAGHPVREPCLSRPRSRGRRSGAS